MASFSELDLAQPPNSLLLGAHPAIDFANSLVPPPGPEIELLPSWPEMIAWLKATNLSDGKNLAIAEAEAPEALATVRNLRRAWRSTLEVIMAGQGVRPQFIKQLNGILDLDRFSELLCADGKDGFHLQRSRSQLKGKPLALVILARSMAEFLATAEFKYLRRCANTDSCALLFYDTTKNHRRQWCSNSLCGNRYKVAEFRRRQRSASLTE